MQHAHRIREVLDSIDAIDRHLSEMIQRLEQLRRQVEQRRSMITTWSPPPDFAEQQPMGKLC